jgi:hypothetical protein
MNKNMKYIPIMNKQYHYPLILLFIIISFIQYHSATAQPYPVAQNLFDNCIRYNRAEGLFIGTPKADPLLRFISDYWLLYPYGDIGYGFKSKKMRYTIGIAKPFYNKKFILGVEQYTITDSDDYWRIGAFENSFAALLIREDFLDLFSREGKRVYFDNTFSNTFIRLEYRADTFTSMPMKTDWSVFGRNKELRPNPPITEGDARSIHIQAIYEKKKSASSSSSSSQGAPQKKRGNVGILYGDTTGLGIFDSIVKVNFNAEYSGGRQLGGDFNYARYTVELIRCMPLAHGDNFNTRILLGTSSGNLPVQKTFFLGGIGTLRGMGYKEFPGSGMFLTTVECLFEPERIFHLTPGWSQTQKRKAAPFKIAFFFDTGSVTKRDYTHYLNDIFHNPLMHDLGIGLVSRDQLIRLDVARRTDKSNQPIRFTVKMCLKV